MYPMRTALAGAFAYVLLFISGVGLTFLLKTPLVPGSPVPTSFLTAQIILSVITGFIVAYWYFRSPLTTPSIRNGFLLGIVLVITGFVFDLLLFSPALIKGYPLSEIVSLYTEPLFWASLVSLVCATTVTTLGFRARLH